MSGAATAATAQVTPTLAAHISPDAHSRVSSGVVPGALGGCYLWFLSILGGRCAPPGIRGSAPDSEFFQYNFCTCSQLKKTFFLIFVKGRCSYNLYEKKFCESISRAACDAFCVCTNHNEHHTKLLRVLFSVLFEALLQRRHRRSRSVVL